MAAPAEKGGAAALQQAYTEVARQMKAQDHAKVLKALNKALELQKGDINLEHAKAIALIRLDRYDDALKSLPNAPNTEFERSYCEYRLQRPGDAFKTLSAVKGSENRRNKELNGQLLYRLEKFDESFEIYSQLMKESPSSGDSDLRDRRANQLGTLAAIALWAGRNVEIPARVSANSESYATLFNEACALLGMQRYEEALSMLDRAEPSCVKQFEEDGFSNEELEAELAYFRVQRGYIAMKRAEAARSSGESGAASTEGRGSKPSPSDEAAKRFEDEASRLFNSVLKLKTSSGDDVDQQLVAIAANNLICLNREANLFDSRKKAKLLQADTLANKLVLAQRYASLFNQALLYFFSNQLEPCRKALNKLTEMRQGDGALLPGSYAFAELRLQVALAAREKQPSKAIEALQGFITKAGSKDRRKDDSEASQQFVGACLLLAELLVAEGRVRDAITSLQRIAENDTQQLNFAVFTRLLSLFEAADDFDEANAFVLRTVRAFRTRLRGNELTRLLSIVTQFYAKHRRVDEAMRVLDELAVSDALQNVNPDSLVNLISVFARFSLERAENMVRQLPAVTQKRVDEIASRHSLDLEALENAFQYGQRSFIKKATTGKQDGVKPRDDAAADKQERKKKRKKRLPKNYDPKVPPDPERWLPKRERSTFKAKAARRRRGDMRVGGTQGAIIRDSAAEQQASAGAAANASAGAKTQGKTQQQQQQPPQPQPSSAASSSTAGSGGKQKKSGKKRH